MFSSFQSILEPFPERSGPAESRAAAAVTESRLNERKRAYAQALYSIRTVGFAHLRPAGISKTMQSMIEEATTLEEEEAEAADADVDAGAAEESGSGEDQPAGQDLSGDEVESIAEPNTTGMYAALGQARDIGFIADPSTESAPVLNASVVSPSLDNLSGMDVDLDAEVLDVHFDADASYYDAQGDSEGTPGEFNDWSEPQLFEEYSEESYEQRGFLSRSELDPLDVLEAESSLGRPPAGGVPPSPIPAAAGDTSRFTPRRPRLSLVSHPEEDPFER